MAHVLILCMSHAHEFLPRRAATHADPALNCMIAHACVIERRSYILRGTHSADLSIIAISIHAEYSFYHGPAGGEQRDTII